MADPIPLLPLTQDECSQWLASETETTRAWVTEHEFDGSAGTTLAIPDESGGIDRLLCGVGRRAHIWSLAHVAGLRLARPLAMSDEAWSDPATARMALGYRLACYRFTRYRERRAGPELTWSDTPAGHELAAIARAVARVRDLVNTPAEDMGPEELATAAWELATSAGGDCRVIEGDHLLEQNFPAIHAVGRAADRAPRLIDVSWGDENHPTLVLIGKGVCFDSGGLDIKPASGMLLMKKDMGGAAHALALAGLVMEHELPVRLRLLIPAVENAISGNAYRPGDVVRTRAGLTVEIGNTDAEGRVILADALAYGCEQSPDLMIDFATLTGAARIALGPDLPPYFTDDEALAQAWEEASAAVEDPVWRMPLYDGYDESIDGAVANVSNTGSLGQAGAVTAALFLRRFVREGVSWSHHDVYAWNPTDRPGRPKGGEAHALRAAWELLRRRY